MQIGDKTIISGIKNTKNKYIGLSQGAIDHIGLESVNQVIGRDDYDLASEVFTSSKIDTNLVAEGLIEQDEYALRGKTVFIFETLYVREKLNFSIIHKSPYMEGNKIVGSYFHKMELGVLNLNSIKNYLSNPEMKITKSTYTHLEVNDLVPSRRYNFSRRELECIGLLVQGLSAKGIARALNLSSRTIEDYLNSIKEKLDVRKLTEIVARVITDGIV